MKRYVCAFMMVVLSLAVSAAPQPLIQFNFDEGSGNVVKSTGSVADVSLQIKSDRLKWVEGRDGGKALFFDNPRDASRSKLGCLTLNMAKYIDFTKPFTVTAWIKVEPDVNGSKQYTILSNVTSDYGPGWRLLYGWGSFRFGAGMGTAKTNEGISITQSKFPHKNNEWHHLSVVYDGVKTALYLNGIKVVEKAMTLGKGNSIFTFGAYAGGSAYGFPGTLSDVKFFNTALSDGEILFDAKGIE